MFLGEKMENAIVNVKKEEQKNAHLFQCSGKDVLSTKVERLSDELLKVTKKVLLILNFKKLQNSENCIPFPYTLHGSNNGIPRQIISVDEKYLLRCLELIHINALKVASWNVTSKMSLGRFSGRTAFNIPRFIMDSPLAAGTDNVIRTNGNCIIGTITRSRSMMSILKSPILCQLGDLNGDSSFERENMVDVRETTISECMSSPGALSISSSQKLQKEKVAFGDQRYASQPVHKRMTSLSSTNSTSSDQSSFSVSAGFSQGMLQCIWKDGFPQHVFSVDGQREIYTATLMKNDFAHGKVSDYIYAIYSRTSGIKELEIHENESELVGKMKVSTSFTLHPNNSKIMETQFILFGSHENFLGEIQTSNHTPRKSRGFSKKMVDVFRTSHSAKQRTSSKFGGTNTPLENSLWGPCQESCKNPDTVGIYNFSAKDPPPNLELAAIIVKDHIHDNSKEAESGGWGLKFLKKSKILQTNASIETSVPSECCQRKTGDCSTSVDILIPAGFHGGPRTRDGGPTTLTERWSSGGLCDCGGWDLGCPLTILGTSLNGKDTSLLAGVPGVCKPLDLFVQGSKQSAPVMKMVNIHNGLYYIHFQSTLSALQSFSIAAAIIHIHSPTLRPKMYSR